MTEVEIVGGPRDGEILDTAGNPERGERVAADGHLYRLYQKNDGAWVGVWVGFEGGAVARVDQLEDDLPATAGGWTPKGEELDRLASMVRDYDRDRNRHYGPRWWVHALAVAVFGASIAAVLFAGLALLSWLLEVLGSVLGWMSLTLAAAVVAFATVLAASIAKPDNLDDVLADQRKTR